MKTKIIYNIKLIVLAVIVLIGTNYVLASLPPSLSWTPPQSSPPDGNVSAPINTGTETQTKKGKLILNTVPIGEFYPGLEVNGDAIFKRNIQVGPYYFDGDDDGPASENQWLRLVSMNQGGNYGFYKNFAAGYFYSTKGFIGQSLTILTNGEIYTGQYGRIRFGDNTVQTTAYTGASSGGVLGNEYLGTCTSGTNNVGKPLPRNCTCGGTFMLMVGADNSGDDDHTIKCEVHAQGTAGVTGYNGGYHSYCTFACFK